MTRLEKIREKLIDAFYPEILNVIDETQDHFGHGGYDQNGSHFAIQISAEIFKDKKLIEAHRLIYAVLDDMMQKEIHALRIKIMEIPPTPL
jgi:BolA protein